MEDIRLWRYYSVALFTFFKEYRHNLENLIPENAVMEDSSESLADTVFDW
tara:strand:+ start:1397 stop:1546 length:150 start_codon:yes stop_codon:yes gene_type:complete